MNFRVSAKLALIGLFIFTILSAIIFYGYWKGLVTVPSFADREMRGEEAVVRRVSELRVEDTRTDEVENLRVSVIPTEALGYRFSLRETDYETYATILVEDVSREVYQKVRLFKDDSRVVDGLIISLTRFVYSGCEGEECE